MRRNVSINVNDFFDRILPNSDFTIHNLVYIACIDWATDVSSTKHKYSKMLGSYWKKNILK